MGNVITGMERPYAVGHRVHHYAMPNFNHMAQPRVLTPLRNNDKRTLSSSVLLLLSICGMLIVLIGKLVSEDTSYDWFFYSYGILVTSAITLIIVVRYAWYRDPYREALRLKNAVTTNQALPLVSIMVAAYNEEDFIAQCVNSLIVQTYPHTEIIVVNDASTDRTATVLKRYHDEPNVRIIHQSQNAGKKKALAEAMLAARGEYFVFTDSDSVLDTEAVARIALILMTQPDIGAVSGHTRAYNASHNFLTHVQDTWYEGQFSIRKAYESAFGAVTCVSGPLAAFRRSAIFNLIPLWINDTFLGSEFKFATDRTKTALVLAHERMTPRARARYPDSPFTTRVTYPPHHWRVVYSQAACAYTNVPETLRAFLRQQIRWKKSFIRNLFLTGSFYWRRPFLAALMYYLRALFVFVGPIIVFIHLIWLPLHGSYLTAALYISGVLFIGFVFATLHKVEKPDDTVWMYRPAMNFISMFMLSWLIFYSLLTIKTMTWHRGL